MELEKEETADVSMQDNSISLNSNLEAQVNLKADMGKSGESVFLTPTKASDSVIVDGTGLKQTAQIEHENCKEKEQSEQFLSEDAIVTSTNPMIMIAPGKNQDTGVTQVVEVSNDQATDRRPPTQLAYQFSHLLCGVGKRGIIQDYVVIGIVRD